MNKFRIDKQRWIVESGNGPVVDAIVYVTPEIVADPVAFAQHIATEVGQLMHAENLQTVLIHRMAADE